MLLFSYLPKPEIRGSTLTSAKLKGKYSHLYAGKAVTSYCRRVTRTLTSHLDWQGKEEKDKWIPLKFSGFNCQFKLCHSMVFMSVCVRVCKFLHLKHFISAWNQSTQQSNYYPFYIKTFLKTPENMQRDKWYVLQVKVLVVLYFFKFCKAISPLWQGSIE